MKLEFARAVQADIDALDALYGDVEDYLAAHINYPGWLRDIYPTRATAQDGIDEAALFVARDGERIAASIILRHKPEPAYDGAAWAAESDYSRILVIYTFAVHPDYMGSGAGRFMLDSAAGYARENGNIALRLDVCSGNEPAIRLYKKCGFEYVATVDLGLGDVGLPWFELYEKLL